jgi:hypothetical protein
MKFALRPLAAAAMIMLATDAGQGASRVSLASGKKPAVTHLAHPEPFRIARPKAAPKNGAGRPPAAANVQKGTAPAAGQKGGTSGAGQNGGTPAAAQKGGAAAPNGGAPAMPMRTAPAGNAPGAGPAARLSPPVPGSQGVRFAAPPTAAAHDGAVSGTNVKPHISALVPLGGGGECGKGQGHSPHQRDKPRAEEALERVEPHGGARFASGHAAAQQVRARCAPIGHMGRRAG